MNLRRGSCFASVHRCRHDVASRSARCVRFLGSARSLPPQTKKEPTTHWAIRSAASATMMRIAVCSGASSSRGCRPPEMAPEVRSKAPSQTHANLQKDVMLLQTTSAQHVAAADPEQWRPRHHSSRNVDAGCQRQAVARTRGSWDSDPPWLFRLGWACTSAVSISRQAGRIGARTRAADRPSGYEDPESRWLAR